MRIRSYEGLEGCPFGATAEQLTDAIGEPKSKSTNRSGEVEYHFDDFVVRFDCRSGRFRECTFVYGSVVRVNTTDVEWTGDGLRRLCREDGEPQECYGAILLFRLGISLTGLLGEDEGSWSLTAFCRGDMDGFEDEMQAFALDG